MTRDNSRFTPLMIYTNGALRQIPCTSKSSSWIRYTEELFYCGLLSSLDRCSSMLCNVVQCHRLLRLTVRDYPAKQKAGVGSTCAGFNYRFRELISGSRNRNHRRNRNPRRTHAHRSCHCHNRSRSYPANPLGLHHEQRQPLPQN